MPEEGSVMNGQQSWETAVTPTTAGCWSHRAASNITLQMADYRHKPKNSLNNNNKSNNKTIKAAAMI